MSNLVMRRYTFELYPNKEQEAAIVKQHRMMAELHNAALQLWEEVYRRERRTLTAYDLGSEITLLREVDPEWGALGRRTAEGVVASLHDAFKAFFRRVKEMKSRPAQYERMSQIHLDKRRKRMARAAARGQQITLRPLIYDVCGYPRYKRVVDGATIPFRGEGNGWRLLPASEIAGQPATGGFTARRNRSLGKGKSHHNLNDVAHHQVSSPSERGETEGVLCGGDQPTQVSSPSKEKTKTTRNWRFSAKGLPGLIKARGCFPSQPTEFRSCGIMYRDGKWLLSVAVKLPSRQTRGTEDLKITFDLIDEFARVERAKGASRARSKEQITGQTQQLAAGSGADTVDLSGDERGKDDDDRLCIGADTVDLSGDERRKIIEARLERGADTVDLSGDERVGHERSHAARGADTVELHRAASIDRLADEVKSERDKRFKLRSWRWRRETKRAARLTCLATRIRQNALHRWTTHIVSRASDLTVIKPDVKAHTASPRGDEKDWGASVATVSTLNRNTLNQSPASAVQMLAYKAAEAGIRCDVIEDLNPNIGVGRDLVATGKLARKAKRKLKKAN